MTTQYPNEWTYAAPAFVVPENACDSHAHVIAQDGDGLIAQRRYTPAPAPAEEYFRMLDRLQMHRGVLVQPSVYGTDNRYLLATLRGNPERLRGVVVLDRILEATVADMHAAGVRGVRINGLFGGGAPLADIDTLAGCIAPFGWHVQLYLDGPMLVAHRKTLETLPCDVVFDHMAHADPGEGTGGEAFRVLLALVRDYGRWVKLSAANRLTRSDATGFMDTLPLANALAEAAPDRVLWGSDWPHVGLTQWPDTGDLLNLVPQWLPDPKARHRLLVDNPARLYGFNNAIS